VLLPTARKARHHCARIGTILVNLEDGGRELRSISERLVRAREAERRDPRRATQRENRSVSASKSAPSAGARPRVGPAGVYAKPSAEHAVVGARLGADCDRALVAD